MLMVLCKLWCLLLIYVMNFIIIVFGVWDTQKPTYTFFELIDAYPKCTLSAL